MNNKILIFTTKFGYYVSHAIKYIIELKKIPCDIIYEIDYRSDLLHIILFSQKVKIYPKNYIIYQLEQKNISNWIDKKYELSIYHSKLTWDYSQSNIDKFHNIIKQKMIFLPIPLVPINLLNNKFNINIIPSNNILFYGSMNSIRKYKINILQKKLYPKYNIKIINNIYGERLIYEILNSKIILNIHFYKDAILETCRINEILACNRFVISEKPNIIDNINYNMYKDKIIFIDNLNDMYDKIIYLLDNNKYMLDNNLIDQLSNNNDQLIDNILNIKY
jgi:hypothetical protein